VSNFNAVTSQNVPNGQPAHSLAPSLLAEEHGKQTAYFDSAIVIDMYVSLGQKVQASAASFFACLPASQDLQSVCFVSSWYLPASQDLQSVCFVSSWYLPVSQATHELSPLSPLSML
jgi:hypothetical protein